MRVRWTGSLLAMVTALACEKRFAAVLQVEVTTDLADASWLELRTRTQDGAAVTGAGQRAWPQGTTQSFNLVPLNDDLAANPDAVFEVVAANCGPSGSRIPSRCVLVSRRLRVRYREGEVRRIRISLDAACQGVVCAGAQSCAGGACVEERWDVTGAPDGGVSDVPGADAAEVATDAGAPRDVATEDRADVADATDVIDVVDAPSSDVVDAGACPVGGCLVAREVSVLGEEACALMEDGSVRCWGAPYGGLFAVAATEGHHLRPSVVPSVTGIGGLSVGGDGYHCVLRSSTEVTCWGSQGPRTRALTDATAPIAQLQCGFRFCCVRLQSGAVQCWGSNDHGQLGDGTVAAAPAPIERDEARPVPGLIASHLACGLTQCCAVLSDGNVRCWGRNLQGQFGNGTFNDEQPSPVAMQGINGRAAAVATNEAASCVLMRDGSLQCVGGDWDGELGDGPGEGRRLTPGPVAALGNNVVEVRAGRFHVCARTRDGGAWCWGSNIESQCLLSTRGLIHVPTRVPLPQVRAIATGYAVTCFVLEGGEVRCGGVNLNGQLGDGTREVALEPRRIGSSSFAVAAGQYHSCSLSANSMYCWGDNYWGQLGVGDTTGRGTPTIVTSARTTDVLALGNRNSCIGSGDGVSWRCAGATELGQLALAPSAHPARRLVSTLGGATMIGVGLGWAHACGRSDRQALSCWGDNSSGQLGNGRAGVPSSTASPTAISGFTDVSQVVSGYAFSCALRSSGAVLCWGDNAFGQLGGDAPNDRATPTAVALPGAATRLFAGQDHACASLIGGEVACWGTNEWGVLGQGDDAARSGPVTLNLPGGAQVRTMALGQRHACAIDTAGQLYCWGRNIFGELGIGRDLNFVSRPERVVALSQVAGVAAGWAHTCARGIDGAVWCWGANDHGQLGIGLPDHPAGGTAVRF